MKLVFLLEAGIPSYRNFLFNYLDKHPEIKELLVIHTGKIYDHKEGNYADERIRFVGSKKLGFHFNLSMWNHLRKADVIVASYNLRIITCWLPCLVFKSKLIFWGKGLGEKESPLVKGLRAFTAKRCSKLLVYNDEKRREIIDKLNIPEDKVVAYQNTIRIDNPMNCGDYEKKYFLYFGRLQERKGISELIEQYSNYVKEVKYPKYNLRIVGDGEIKDGLIRKVNELSLGRYVEFFPGVYEEENIFEHFKNAVYYVSPFNVGLSVVNSFSYGIPILTCTSPQVGPEYYYLNESNSIRVEKLADFSYIFEQIENQKIIDEDKVYEFYLNTLDYTIMESNFLNTILSVNNE